MASEKSIADIVEDLPDHAPEWWSRERAAYMFRQLSPKHLAVAREMMKGKEWRYGTAFRRVRMQPNGKKRSMAELRTDGIAGCLRTPKGGSGRQILFRAGKGRYDVRLLTPRECARLMGADDFQVSGSLNDALFGFGDAVCVPAITWIAENVIPIKADVETWTRARVGT
jgi:DNA (cytosine-5)-methyltransferase 1